MQKRHIAAIGAAGAVVLGVPAAALGITGTSSTAAPHRTSNVEHADRTGSKALRQTAAAPQTTSSTDYDAYVAMAGDYGIDKIDVDTDKVLGYTDADSPQGVAVSSDNTTGWIAQSGQYSVLKFDTATDKVTATINVGAYPEDDALTPDGKTLYVTVTGGDTGPGVFDKVAVINTSTDAVTTDITVGSVPRQITVNKAGTLAYVTTFAGVSVINTATNKVVGTLGLNPAANSPGAALGEAQEKGNGPQDEALSTSGKYLFVTLPDQNQVVEIDTASLRVVRKLSVPNEPYSVAVTPDGGKIWVAETNDNKVVGISTATGRVTDAVTVADLPMSVAVTPDGSQVWAANGLTGTVSVIDAATDKVTASIPLDTDNYQIDSAALDIVFVPTS